MRKHILCCLIIFSLFLSCTKKVKIENTENTQNNNESIDISKNVPVQEIQNNNENTEKYIGPAIEDISYNIFTDLEIKWDYNSFEDLFATLNISDQKIVAERSIENWYSPGTFIIYYDFESNRYKFTVYTLSDYPHSIHLVSIIIEINDRNYLHMFPHNNIEDYLEDINFGKISEINQDKNWIHYIMRYGEDDRFGYSRLYFDNGLLKSVEIITYTP